MMNYKETDHKNRILATLKTLGLIGGAFMLGNIYGRIQETKTFNGALNLCFEKDPSLNNHFSHVAKQVLEDAKR